MADDNVHRVTAFSPFIPAGTKKTFIAVGTAMFDAATVVTIADAEIDTGVKDYAKTGGGQVPDGEIPADIARDTEIPTNAEIDARADARVTAGTKAFAQTGGGQVPDADIPDAIARDSEIPTNAEIDARIAPYARATPTGTIDDAQIPAGIARDSEVPTNAEIDARVTAGVKEFARTGERGVRVGDMDSQTATDGQVPTADGSGDVAWEDQSGTTPPADQTIRGAISTDDTLELAEYNAGTTSDTQEIMIPTWTMGNRYVFIGVPENENDITDIDQNGISEFADWATSAWCVREPQVVAQDQPRKRLWQWPDLQHHTVTPCENY